MLETDREAKRSQEKVQNMFQGLSTLILTLVKHIFQLKTKIQWAWDEKYADCWQECRFLNNNKQEMFKNGPSCILKCFHEKRCNNIKTATTKQTTKTTSTTTTTTTTTSTTTTTTKALGTTTSTTSNERLSLLCQKYSVAF